MNTTSSNYSTTNMQSPSPSLSHPNCFHKPTYLSPYSTPAIPSPDFNYPCDPRASSTASLAPINNESNKRTLLCIFIHGFVGNEMSFRSFPAYLHQLLTVLVQESHAVHTKIHRFKTRNALSIAVKQLSDWLKDFESPTTDIVLCGHSMGGLMAADTVLRGHRILGIVCFDSPFMGIEPRVVFAGLASIFKPERKCSPDIPLTNLSELSLNCSSSTLDTVASSVYCSSSSQSVYSSSSSQSKKSTLNSAFGFIAKHRTKTMSASLKYVTSHMEFTASLLDVVEMRSRLEKIRAFEETDEVERRRRLDIREGQATPPRVGFVNYYTASILEKKGGKPSNDITATDGAKKAQCSSAVDGVIPLTPPCSDSKNSLTGELKEFEAGQSGGTEPPNADQNQATHTAKKDKIGIWKSVPKLRRKPRPNAEKTRTFCVIPTKGGVRDPSWVEVRMQGDEVSAHCGLFFVDDEKDSVGNISTVGKCIFERLLGDVATRILEWTQEKPDFGQTSVISRENN